MAKDEDILRDAIIGTEKEIAAEAWGQEDLTLDDSGDRSLEAMGDGLEGQVEPDEDEENESGNPDGNPDEDPKPDDDPDKSTEPEANAEKKPETKAETQPEPQGRVPAGRLREEAERARTAIAERDALKAQLDAEKAANAKAVSDLNAKFDALLALQQRQPPQGQQTPQPQPQKPDLFEDPNAFAEYLNKGVQDRFDAFVKSQRDREVNASIDAARTKHGQVFEDAWKALSSLPKNLDSITLARGMEASPNPGEAIVSWHKRNQAMRTVGDDIDAYNARIAKDTREQLIADPEFRKELLASLRGEAMAGDQGQPRTSVRLPKSLNRTPGSNTRAPNDLEMFDGSESAIAASAWST